MEERVLHFFCILLSAAISHFLAFVHFSKRRGKVIQRANLRVYLQGKRGGNPLAQGRKNLKRGRAGKGLAQKALVTLVPCWLNASSERALS